MADEKILEYIKEDIEALFELSYDAIVQHDLGGLGGCKHFEAEAYPAKFRKYIVSYVETDASISECVVDYLADNGYLRT